MFIPNKSCNLHSSENCFFFTDLIAIPPSMLLPLPAEQELIVYLDCLFLQSILGECECVSLFVVAPSLLLPLPAEQEASHRLVYYLFCHDGYIYREFRPVLYYLIPIKHCPHGCQPSSMLLCVLRMVIIKQVT